jgi:hypothetical protein
MGDVPVHPSRPHGLAGVALGNDDGEDAELLGDLAQGGGGHAVGIDRPSFGGSRAMALEGIGKVELHLSVRSDHDKIFAC